MIDIIEARGPVFTAGSTGNALLYKELERTVKENVSGAGHCDLVQIAETTWLMMKDLENLGANIHKRHRLYEKML